MDTEIDAIIVSEPGGKGTTGIVPERLTLEGRPLSIQTVRNFLENGDGLSLPIEGDGVMSWWSAPKLNGIYLHNYLTREGFRVGLINKYFREKEAFRTLLAKNPRVVVISTTFIRDRHSLHELVSDIRSLAPGITIIAGGSFAYLSYLVLQRSEEPGYLTEGAREDLLFFHEDDPEVDFYVVSLTGEQSLSEILRRIVRGESPDSVPNTAAFANGQYAFSRRVDDIGRAGEAVIDWKALPDEVFSSGVVPVQTSKGCPYRCAFCNFVRDRRLMFAKPIDTLLEELRAVSECGAKFVWFVDDNFRLGARDLDAVCRRFVDERLDLRWMTMLRADTLDRADVELLRRAGCVEVQLGLESGDPQILKNMNKGASPSLYRRVVKRVLGTGITCSGYFIFGFPGETDETALRTRAFIQDLESPDLDGTLMWSLFPFSLYPLSPVYEVEERRKYGLSGYLRKWRHDTMDSARAMEHVRQAFFELEDSCPVYRGDNLDMLLDLGAKRRKEFLVQRHRLSKEALKRTLGKEEVRNTFSVIFS